jgi:hypothetical protein
MSADKLQAVHEALAAVFNESKLNATGTETSHAVFDHETLSEAFSEPQLNVANTEQSFARFNHAALTGIFRESFPTSPTEGPSPTSFDQAFAEILRERSPISTNIKPSQPSFDHQALAEMLSELRADPINPQTSPLSFATESSSAPFPGQIDHEEPVAKAFAGAPPTNAESARPPRAKSLLAKLHHIFSTKEEPPLSSVEKDPLPPSLSGQLHTPEPMTKAISTLAESALPQPAKLPLAELSPPSFEQEPKSPCLSGQPGNVRASESDVVATSTADNASTWSPRPMSFLARTPSLISDSTEASPPIFGKAPSGPILSDRLDLESVRPAEKPDVESAQPQQPYASLTELPPQISTITKLPPPFETEPSRPILSGQPGFGANAAPTDAGSAEARQAKSFSVELPPFISINREISPLIRQETSHPTPSGQPDNLESTVEIVAAAAPADTENARSQLAESYLPEIPPLISTDTEPSLPNFQTETSLPTLSGRLENMASTASTVAPFPPTNAESARPQRLGSLLAELTPIISANPKPPLATSDKEPSRPTSSTQLKNLGPVAKTASVVPLTNSEGAVMQPREAKLLLSEILSPNSTSTKPQPFIFEKDSSPIIESRQPKHAEPAAEIVAAAPLPDAEDARPQQGKSLLADLHTSRFERKPSHAIFSGELDKVGPAVETVAANPPANAATAQQTKSLPLTDLPALVSTNTKSSFPNFEQDLRSPSLSGQPDSVVPSVNSVRAADPTDAEGARPQHLSSLLAALRVLTAKPSPPVLEKEASRSTPASQPDNAGMLVETIAHPSDGESALAQPPKSLLTEMPALVSTYAKSSAPIFEKERWRPPVSDQPANEVPTTQAVAVASSADTESAVTRAQQAKSLLAELDLNTAVHLRWVMRDIRSKRTKFSPVSANDLTALMDLGLVEMRDGLPRLTALGVLALD